jgi:hypothetical protein
MLAAPAQPPAAQPPADEGPADQNPTSPDSVPLAALTVTMRVGARLKVLKTSRWAALGIQLNKRGWQMY